MKCVFCTMQVFTILYTKDFSMCHYVWFLQIRSHILNDQELVSLSVNSKLKLWNINTTQWLKIQTYTGYKNERTFVGLSGNLNHWVCGLEDNCTYAYSKHVSKHLTSYTFDTLDESTNAHNHFVCSVCWKPDCALQTTKTIQQY